MQVLSLLQVLSLFSGIGGLDLGLQRAGMTIAGQVEIDPWCRKVLARHWPEVPRHDDVRTCPEWWGDRTAPDLVCGGFPCQPTSSAGKRLAQADSRWLWPAFHDVIRRLRPRFVLVENPASGFFAPVLVKDGEGRFVGYGRPPIEDVLGDLAAIRYDAEWDVIPAAYFGAPHIRERVLIVAYPAGAGSPDRPATPGGQSSTPRRLEPERLGGHVADTQGLSSELRQATEQRPGRPASGRLALADATGIRRGDEPRIFRRVGPARCGWWPAEPAMGRVAHGVPDRVDRLRGLGNAVVPQVAEHIGRMIMAAAS